MFNNLPKFTPPGNGRLKFHPQGSLSSQSTLLINLLHCLLIMNCPGNLRKFHKYHILATVIKALYALNYKSYTLAVISLFWILQPSENSCSISYHLGATASLFFSKFSFILFIVAFHYSKDSLGKLQIIFKQLSSKKYKALLKDGASELSAAVLCLVGRENKSDCFILGPINRYWWCLMQFFHKLLYFSIILIDIL